MKRIFMLLAAMLLLTGCAGHAQPERGLIVTVERNDIYSISCSTEYETSVGQRADNAPLVPGESLYFNPSEAKVHYTISVKNTAGATIVTEDFTDDFSGGPVELVVTEDGRILRAPSERTSS